MEFTSTQVQNRLTELLSRKKENLLSIFYTAGYPGLESTVEIAQSLQRSGVDLIEIGIPFSDPVADGAIIQESSAIAIRNGMTVEKLLDQLIGVRKTITIPILLMGYLNPVMQYGFEAFCRKAAEVGVDGVILPDLPLLEYEREYQEVFEANNLSTVFLISPNTTEERIRRFDQMSSGFLYAVSSTSTTGSRQPDSGELERYLDRLRLMKLKRPWLTGFGISSHSQFAKVCRYGAGGIVGSAFIRMLGESHDLQGDIGRFVSELRGPVHAE